MGHTGRTFEIRQVTPERVKPVLAFHLSEVGEYLWPRTEEQLRFYADALMLWEAVEGSEIVGVCYVAAGDSKDPDVEPVRYEFGGIFVPPKHRGTGIASALGKTALISLWVNNMPLPLIAHVHEDNPKPRNVLDGQLGFTWDGGAHEDPPPELAPETMKRNAQGHVVGHLFVFQRKKLQDFAEWLEKFDGTISGKAGVSSITIKAKFASETRANAIVALRDLAKTSDNPSASTKNADEAVGIGPNPSV